MKRILITLAVLGLLTVASVAQGTFDTDFSQPMAGPVGQLTPPWGSLDFNQVGPNTVQMTLTSLIGDAAPGVFVSELGFNFNGDASSLTFTPFSSVGTFATPTIGTSGGYAFDGGGRYDVQFSFGKSQGQRFENTDSLTYTITGNGLTTDLFNKLASPHGANGVWVDALHLQGGLGNDSYVAGVMVPEPTSIALAGLGLAALVIFRKRN